MMCTLQSLIDNKFDFDRKTVFLRVDFNVPMTDDGEIQDDSRIVAALPTIQCLCDFNARVVVVSHYGRPNGVDPKLSLLPVANKLRTLVEVPIFFIEEMDREMIKTSILNVNPGCIAMLENIRFHPEEEENMIEFSTFFASFIDVYVNDAFGAIHRPHSSIVGIPKLINTKCCGFLMEKELELFRKLSRESETPFVAIIGGSKISTKINFIEGLLPFVDHLIIGGAMTFSFLHYFGLPVGGSFVETDQKDGIMNILQESKRHNVEIHFPLDIVVVKDVNNTKEMKIVPNYGIPNGWIGVDQGPITLKRTKEILSDAKYILWNGPLGMMEKEDFAKGTKELIKELIRLKTSNQSVVTVAVGGHTVGYIKEVSSEKDFTHVSTGGGSFLSLFEGGTLPGLSVLE